MDTSDLLTDHFGRIRELFVSVADGLSAEDAHRRPEGQGNPIAWLLWHAVRIQDDHLAGLTGEDAGVARRVGGPVRPALRRPTHTGYGHSEDEVGALRIEDLQLLVDYQEAGAPLAPCSTSRRSTPTSWTAWSTSTGTRRSRQACDWSA